MKKLIMIVMLGVFLTGCNYAKVLTRETSKQAEQRYQKDWDRKNANNPNRTFYRDAARARAAEREASGFYSIRNKYGNLASSFEKDGYTSKTYLLGDTYTTVTKSCYSCSESISTYTTY